MSKYDELLEVVTSLEDRIAHMEKQQNKQRNFVSATNSKIRAITHHLDFELLLNEDGFQFHRAIPNKK